MFPRQLQLYSYVISSIVSLCFVCVCLRIYSICQILSPHLSEGLQTLVDISLLYNRDAVWWCYGKCIEIRWPEEIGRSWQELLTPNSVYVFAFHAFETSILWSTIVFWKLYCSNVYLCSIHYQRITSYVELFFQICQAHFSFLRHLLKCWFLKLLTMLKNLVYKGNRCHFLMDCNCLALSRAMLLEYYWSQRREPLFD